MRPDFGQDQWRDHNDAAARVGLGRTEVQRLARRLGELTGHPDDAGGGVDVAATQRGQFAPAQATKAGQQDQCPVARADRGALG